MDSIGSSIVLQLGGIVTYYLTLTARAPAAIQLVAMNAGNNGVDVCNVTSNIGNGGAGI